jgi:orotidine-5'-phosphate decarboxylase
MVHERFGDRLAILVPGVRAEGGATQDQARVVTPQQAVAAGARYIIAGRMITAAADRRAAMQRLLAELD